MANNEEKTKKNGGSWLDSLLNVIQGEPTTREQLFEVLRAARERDLIDQDALDMIQRVIHVSDLRVRDAMLPRSQMVVVDKSQPPEGFLPLVIESAHSRFPVIDDGERDKVIGIMLAKDLLNHFQDEDTQFNWRDMLRPAVVVPESKRLNVLLTEFRASRNHMAIVVDEYGGVSGLITIEDVIEQIVGDIEDEHDVDEEDLMILKHGENEFVVKALVPLEDMSERLGCKFEHEDVDTAGGLVVNRFQRMPKIGDSVAIEGFKFEVLNADSRQVHLLRATRLAS
ncbi:MAG: HlyC/CorC family transporter [Arenicellales bacterium WSBS_2016_MAG_OTU3]